MTNWNINPTFKKLSKLSPVNADSLEGQEIKELVEGMLLNKKEINAFVLADYAYTLGMARGKQIDRERRKKGDRHE